MSFYNAIFFWDQKSVKTILKIIYVILSINFECISWSKLFEALIFLLYFLLFPILSFLSIKNSVCDSDHQFF